MKRYELTDAQWRRLKPLLPPERPRTGRPNHDHRTILNGIDPERYRRGEGRDAVRREVTRHVGGRSEVVGDDVFDVLEEEVGRDAGDSDVHWVG